MDPRVNVQKLGVILEPTRHPFERRAVLNPGVLQHGNTVHLYYRAVDERFRSSIGYARLEGPTQIVERFEKPLIGRKHRYESHGVEDPRVVKIGDMLYMTYVAHDGKNAITAYATGRDPLHFRRRGIVSPLLSYDAAASIFRDQKLKDRYFMFESFYEEQAGKNVLLWSKDLFFFPKKINGKFALIQRVLPDMQIMYFKKFSDLKNLAHWRAYLEGLADHVLFENKYWFESRNIGGGAPPLETRDGWLLVYHGVEELNKSRIYHAGAALLDLKNPSRVIGRCTTPLFSPTEPWETEGMTPGVVFPTGTAQFGDTLYIYYGAADSRIAVAAVNLPDLLRTLKTCGV